MKEFFRFLKFALISASAGLIELGSFTLFNELLHWPYWLSYMVALVLSVLWNFTVNRKFTFKSAANIPVAMLKVFGFYCVFTPVSVILGEIAAQKLTWSFAEYLILGVTMATNMVTEFLFCRFVVYKDSMNTNDSAKKQEKDSANV